MTTSSFTSPQEYLSRVIREAAAAWARESGLSLDEGGLRFSIESKDVAAFGDYSANVAFALAPLAGAKPRDIANDLAARIAASEDRLIASVEVAGGGFMNFFMAPAFWQLLLEQELGEAAPCALRIGDGEKVIIEYSSPNVAKPMHVGHLRATILGDFLANLYEKLGFDVIRWNHVGDWGTQFGKLIVAYTKWGSKEKVEASPIPELLALYIRFHEEAKADPSLEDEARKAFKKLEDKDPASTELLDWFLRESMKEFNALYAKLEIHPFDVVKGESEYGPLMPEVVRELGEAGLTARSEGALIVPLDSLTPPLPPALVEKSDGSTLYFTRDLASLKYRIQEGHARKIMYVVGDTQELHFRQLFAAAAMLWKDNLPGLEHVSFGLVLNSDRKKFATREGVLVKAEDLIDEIVAAAQSAISDKQESLSDEDKQFIAQQVGIGALKYNMLKDKRESAIVFSADAALSLSGNSSPYIQYAYARLASILAKAGPLQPIDVSALEDKDFSLFRRASCFAFSDALKACHATSSSHHLTDYLFSLANALSTYYESTPILKDENAARRNARLLILQHASTLLHDGLAILGINTPSKI
jgi:arginyl-tRNA synthetase